MYFYGLLGFLVIISVFLLAVGTVNVIDACVQQGVRRLVYSNTVDTAIGYDDIVDGDESTPVPETLLFDGYAETKLRAERLVLAANGRLLAGGKGSGGFFFVPRFTNKILSRNLALNNAVLHKVHIYRGI